MENKKTVSTGLSVVMLILTVFALVVDICNFSAAASAGVIQLMTKIMYMLSLVAAFAYVVGGAKKNAAVFFKIVCIIYVLTYFVSFINRCSFETLTSDQLLTLILGVVELVVMCIFLFYENLGQKKSFVLANINLGCSLLFVGGAVVSGFGPFLACIGEELLSVIFLLMVTAKYEDKAARGTV